MTYLVKVQLLPAIYLKSRKRKMIQSEFLPVFWSGWSKPHSVRIDLGLQDYLMSVCVWESESVCAASRALCAIRERRQLLKWFSVPPPLPCFYWPRWMLQRGNQMWDRDDLKGQVINIICLNFLILMGWCLRCWPQSGGKHDPLNLKWVQSKGFQASESSAPPVKRKEFDFVCVCAHMNTVLQQSVPTARSFNFLFTK